MKYDLIVIGSGPGGYAAAIRASQLGIKSAVIEKEELGGICLNWGCIPTKSLLKSAQVYQYIKNSSDYGISIKEHIEPDLGEIVKRSREIASNMSKGINYLFKKNNIDIIKGFGKLKPSKIVEVESSDGKRQELKAKNIIIATGARSRELPELKQDGKKIIGYRDALILKNKPESVIIVGSGAIGSEFAYFYNSIGSKVILIEYMPDIVPLEDEDVSKQLARSFKKSGMKIMTESSVEKIDLSGEKIKVTINTKKGTQEIETDIVLSAVGITANIENIGLEETGIKTKDGKITVDEFYRTNIEGYYAIGDVIPGQALAHVATAEAIACVEKISGKNNNTLDYNNIPACTYCSPEIASVGYTEKAAIEAGIEIKVGKFPFMASGKASTSGKRDGFVKIIFNNKNNEMIGLHMIGENVTEMIAEGVIAKKLKCSLHDIIKSIHPHPTMSEAIMEAAANANNEAIHI